MQDTFLLVIDLQEAMRAECAVAGPWANPQAPAVAGALLAAFRAAGLGVVHVHHHGDDPADGFHPENPLSRPMAEVAPLNGEPVVIKHGSSGFIGTGLEDLLRKSGARSLVVVGGEANMCVESTTRMAGNLGFRTTVVADALVNFARPLRDGSLAAPQMVLEMSLANLTSFARISDSATVLAEIAS